MTIEKLEDYVDIICDCKTQNTVEEEIKNVEEVVISESQSESPISSLEAFMRLRGHEARTEVQKDKNMSKKHKAIDLVIPGVFSEFQKDLLSMLREINKEQQTVLYLPCFSIPVVHVITSILFNVSRRNERFVLFQFTTIFFIHTNHKQDVDSR